MSRKRGYWIYILVGPLVIITAILVTGILGSTGKGDSYCQCLSAIYREQIVFELKSNADLNYCAPLLERVFGIESQADKGTIGYWYDSDSVFMEDYREWMAFFDCDS